MILLPIVAFLYAAVGHGGASGYLALMGLFSIETSLMKGSALTLNLFVSSIAFYQYWRAGYFKWNLFWPFALASVPMAFLGGTIDLDPVIYKRILAVCLLFAVARMLIRFKSKENKSAPSLVLCLAMGGLLGFFSGLIGIGRL